MSAVFLFAAGEEISWGQRIFEIDTPDALVDANRQQETNLHNLGISGFDEYRLFTLFWYPYVLLLPALAALLPAVRHLTMRLLPTVAAVAWPVGLLYLVNDVLAWVVGKSLAADGGYSAKTDFPRVELRETLFAVLTTLTAYLVLRAVRARNAAVEGALSPDSTDRRSDSGASIGLEAR